MNSRQLLETTGLSPKDLATELSYVLHELEDIDLVFLLTSVEAELNERYEGETNT